MTIALILAVVAVLAAGFLLRAARGQSALVHQLQELEGRTQPVDLAAFRNLVDSAEEEFLRANLPPGEFRTIQRQRMRAAVEYVSRAAHNAAILLRLGEAVRRQSAPEIAQAGQELVNSALRLRVYALFALCVLYARIALPGARISSGRIIETYQALTENAVRLTRLQDPAYAARVAAVI